MKRYFVLAAVLVSAIGSNSSAQVPKIKLEMFLPNVDHPVWLTHDSAKRLIMVEQPGKVRLIINGKLQEKPYLDIVSRVAYGGEMGLLSCVFHPDFDKNGYIYVDYTRMLVEPSSQPPPAAPGRRGRGPQGRRQTVISEFHVDPTGTQVDPASERIILTIDQPFPNHNGGQLVFGPDDHMLYIGMGDGGSARDPQKRGQNLQDLLAKILRIDVTPREGYAVPADNPFVGRADARPEIWAYGLRNPWRMSFDRETKQMWVGDIGQDIWEEVDIITKGGNYGWNLMEANHEFPPGQVQNIREDLIRPVKEYHHTVGLSVTGGFVYRGKKIPSLVGWYVYADYSKGTIWGLKYENGKVTGDETLIQTRTQPSSFGEDLDGEIYLCDYTLGNIFKIVAAQ